MNQAMCRAYQAVANVYMKRAKLPEPKRVDGADSIYSIPELLEQEQKWAPMVVTGPTMGKSNAVTSMFAELTERAVLYDQVHPNPTISQVEEMVALYQASACDSIVAIGGGSSMDAAKAMAACIARPEKRIWQLKGVGKVGKETPFMIAVPTTAGTGSETTMAAVITDEKDHHKYAINDSHLIPDVAVLDPFLTVSMPPSVTAATGMDALTHAIEAYLNLSYHNEDTRGYCEEAVEAIFTYLPQAYEQGDSLEAREEMLIASFLAGEAFTRACVGNVHAIAHTLGGLYGVPHGVANAVILPIVLDDYGSAVYEPLARLSEIAGILDEGTTEQKAKALIARIREMNAHMELPEHIPQIKETDIKQMATWAEKEANPLYPVPVIYTEEHFEDVIRKVKSS